MILQSRSKAVLSQPKALNVVRFLEVYAACIRFCKAADKPLVSKKKIPYKSFKV